MAKVSGPLLSFGGRGQIGKAAVFTSWRGVKVARQYVIPANPQTTEQQLTRTTFATLREMWKLASAAQRAPWDLFSRGRPFTGVNKFVGENIRVLRGEADCANFLSSPGANGGIGATSITTIPGGVAGELDMVFVDPTLPAGWAITNHWGVVFPDQDPALDFVGPFTQLNDVGASPTLLFTGLTAGADYCATGWIEMTKPNGETAYSPSWVDIVQATP